MKLVLVLTALGSIASAATQAVSPDPDGELFCAASQSTVEGPSVADCQDIFTYYTEHKDEPIADPPPVQKWKIIHSDEKCQIQLMRDFEREYTNGDILQGVSAIKKGCAKDKDDGSVFAQVGIPEAGDNKAGALRIGPPENGWLGAE